MGRRGYTGGGPKKGQKTVERLLEELKARKLSPEGFRAALAAQHGKTPEQRRLEIARKNGFETWEGYQAALKKRHEQTLKMQPKLKALRERSHNRAVGFV